MILYVSCFGVSFCAVFTSYVISSLVKVAECPPFWKELLICLTYPRWCFYGVMCPAGHCSWSLVVLLAHDRIGKRLRISLG